MSGELLFQLNARGQGLGEYTDINAFAVNASLHQLVIYDNMKQSLMFYSTEDGRFVKSEKFNKPTPAEIAYWEDTSFIITVYIETIKMIFLCIITC